MGAAGLLSLKDKPMWETDEQGQRVFAGGLGNWPAAAAIAGRCGSFRADDEDEQCADDELSCFNCRYRRWTADSFACLAP